MFFLCQEIFTRSVLFENRHYRLGDLRMKGSANRQMQGFAAEDAEKFCVEMKCVTVAIFEKEGKTVLQPMVSGKEAKSISELFSNRTLEVWLSNGESDLSLFDVAILKYKQSSQPLTKCGKVAGQVCLKNLFDSVVCCCQCPLSEVEAESQDDRN
jgi:hypothetical protein